MNTALCRKKAKEILKGKNAEGIFVVSLCILMYLIFKVADIAVTILILYFGGGDAQSLFMSGDLFSFIIKAVRFILGFVVLSPLVTGGIWWFYQTACGRDNKSVLKLYTGFRLNVRGSVIYIVLWIMCMISLLPTGICWAMAVRLFGTASEYDNQDLVIFIIFQLIMAGIFLLGLYLKMISTFALVPFIFISHPDMGILKMLKMSKVRMYGAKLEFLKLAGSFVPLMLPVFTIPLMLSRAVMAMSVFAEERLKEE